MKVRERLTLAHAALLEGRAGRFTGAVLKTLLVPPAVGFALGSAARRRAYASGFVPVAHVGVPVISVGNLTAGGTGKTVVVEWIARVLSRRNLRPAIVARGYGAPPDADNYVNEEARMLAQNLPDVSVVCDGNRVRAARRAIRDHNAGVIVLDDALSHLAIARDLEVITIDATRPFGFGWRLPRGLLREPPSVLARADVIIITRTDLVSDDALRALERRVGDLSEAPIVLATHQPKRVSCIAGNASSPAESLRGVRAFVFSGLGNPDAFLRTLTDLGVTIAGEMRFADHHLYSICDIETITAAARENSADVILTTRKDRVKIASTTTSSAVPFKSVDVALKFVRGEDVVLRALDEACAPTPPNE